MKSEKFCAHELTPPTPEGRTVCLKCGRRGLLVNGMVRWGNYWTEEEAGDDIELPRCIHGRPRNVFCARCEA
jgi:hypothetical protein